MQAPRPEVLRYLERCCPGATLHALAGDASTRRFYRAALPGGESRVVMDYGAPFEGESDDMRLCRVFTAAGLPVASILDAAPDYGCLLLEDLGDRMLEAELRGASDVGRGVLGATAGPPPLLGAAVDLAARVAERGTPSLERSERRDGPALDEERFVFEMEFFLEHYASALRGVNRPAPALRRELAELARAAADSPRKVLCHRDFHSRNLMVTSGGGLAMVDIQDARWGPDSYDLASLLRDAYVEIDEAWVEPSIARYLDGLADPPEPAAFRTRFQRVAAQRMIKALGTFGFQTIERGSERYVDAAERTIRRLRVLLPGQEATRVLGELLLREGLLS
jgi:aminoglycoside/choline kinase family phosphotransferase